ncbi:MAG: hypothetical protein KJO87_07160 [Acidimicrobiia bacterium]|nr:hypothetical protein [Acidimicrobiia bacterium]NNL70733.1 hypothetical protein [Acidimicrobiia bacterium]
MHRALIIALALIAAACGGDSAESTTATTAATTTTTAADTTTTTAAPATTTTTTVAATTTTASAAGPDARPATPVTAVLGADPANGSYYTAGEFDATVMGIELNTVTAEWYRAEGFFVVFFNGVDTSDTGPLCPGASVATENGFEFVSNAPTTGADCSGFITLTEDPGVRALECDGALAYRTAIPENSAGFLFGTLERPVGDGIMGLTSFVDNRTGDIPEVDPTLFEC